MVLDKMHYLSLLRFSVLASHCSAQVALKINCSYFYTSLGKVGRVGEFPGPCLLEEDTVELQFLGACKDPS